MALVRCDFFSEVLELGTSMTVLLPQAGEAQIGVATGSTAREEGFPLLYLLHGLSDDSSAWQRYTSIERYAAPLGLAVVMPQVQRSFYADEAHGGRYWTFLSEELPSVVESFFRVSRRREDTFVAGLSMGGYGALKWALREPERFAAAASLSGALDVVALQREGDRAELFERVLDGGISPGDDLFALLEAADVDTLPSISVGCGTEDPLLAANERFVAACREHDVDLDAGFGPGAHDWGYWDTQIQAVLDWLPLKD